MLMSAPLDPGPLDLGSALSSSLAWPAAGAAPEFFSQLAILVMAAACIAYFCQRFGLVPILGFLMAGAVIGPSGIGWVTDRELVDAAAEVGVILLLFTVGIEFNLERLQRIRGLIFGGGGLQVALATGVTVAALMALGFSWQVGLFTGFLVALSSTAIVLKLLGDRGEIDAPAGRVSVGLLIFQDLAIVVMALLVPALGGGGESMATIPWSLAKAAALIVVVLVVARRAMPKVLEAVARTCSPELFLLAVVAICFGTAWLTSLVGLSLSLGAFLAGLVVSESSFSEHAMGEILPLQILFSATFFVSVGMLLDLSFVMRQLPLILALLGSVLGIKLVTTAVAVRALGHGLPVVVASSLTLAQVGEFSFVLAGIGRAVGLEPAFSYDAFIAVTVLLMALTPSMAQLGNHLGRRLADRRAQGSQSAPLPEAMPEHLPHLSGHVIVAGYGQAARRLVRVLTGARVPFLVTTLSPPGATEAEGEGMAVIRGDATRPRLLQLAGIDRAKLLVVPDDDPATAERIVTVARMENPTLRILVRTRWTTQIERLEEAGADRVIAEELEGVVQLFADVLRDYRVDSDEIFAHEEALRAGGYAAIAERSETPPAVDCDLGPDCFDTRTVTVRAGTPAAEVAPVDLDLEAEGITLQSWRRAGRELEVETTDRDPLRPGDQLILVGQPTDFARVADLFRTDRERGERTGDAAPSASPFPAPPAPRTTVDPEAPVELTPSISAERCSHLGEIRTVFPSARGCEECLASGDDWVHLRICMTCGHVGCCDSSKNRHASGHHRATHHPIMRSLEPGETWGWCFVDEETL